MPMIFLRAINSDGRKVHGLSRNYPEAEVREMCHGQKTWYVGGHPSHHGNPSNGYFTQVLTMNMYIYVYTYTSVHTCIIIYIYIYIHTHSAYTYIYIYMDTWQIYIYNLA